MNILTVRVNRRWATAKGSYAFELSSIDGEMCLPYYAAGAHIDIHLPNGLIRQYSLCGDPDIHNRYQIAVLNLPNGRGGSSYMHEHVAEGQLIKISEPRNAFSLYDDKHHKVLIAGGIGITPLLAMAYELQKRSNSFELHYFVRSRELLAFQKEICSPRFEKQVFLHIDDEPDGQTLEGIVACIPSGAHVYSCGPSGFLTSIRDMWRTLGRSDKSFHFELFNAPNEVTQGCRFEVQIASTGQMVTVEENETVVAALALSGVKISVSCEQGICGTCVTRIKSGIPDHRDQFLDDVERGRNDCFTPCCSRSKSSLLVLDL
jgi:vanillate O-demethylase ferredoxin subunit